MTFRMNFLRTPSGNCFAGNDRLFVRSAERNAPSIIKLAKSYAPKTGKALEIASGSGQHVVQLAGVLPGLTWQPSDISNIQMASINLWIKEARLANIKPPILLDATNPGWSSETCNQDFILVVNLLHLISFNDTKVMIEELSKALAFGGRLMLCGPFMRDGKLTSDGDVHFHQCLRKSNVFLGYKDDVSILRLLDNFGLILVSTEKMPANNLAFVAEKLNE